MRLLLFSDLHADVAAAHRLVERAHNADIVVGAGDFGNARRNVDQCIEVLRALSCPAVLVPGNSESVEELTQTCRSWPQAHVLHGSGVTIAGIAFFGVGGGIPPTPFGAWSYDFTEVQAAQLLSACPAGGVLVSHSPPQGTLDISSQGRSLGSVAVRDTIIGQRPVLVVCGHIHACAGQQARLGSSTVINAGPGGMEWVLDSQ